MRPDPTSFTRFQQMLLGTDGTVTHLLEAYAGEPMEVVKLLQEFDTSTFDDAHLDLPEDEKVPRRQVVLRGGRSRKNLLYAEAVVALRRVEPAFLDGLVGTDQADRGPPGRGPNRDLPRDPAGAAGTRRFQC